MTSESRAQLCEEQKLRASEASNPSGSLFGETVDIDGDVAVVGGSQLDSSDGMTVNVGAAYVYRRDGANDLGERWDIEDTIFSSNMQGQGMFGQSVAISGDTILVGAPGESTVTGTGKAYVWVFNGTNWAEEATLAPTNEVAGALFGFDVAIDGDLAVVGAPQDDDDIANPTVTNTGAVYVFERTGTTWNLLVKLTADFGLGGDGLGGAVAVDELTRLVLAGAKLDDLPSETDAGSVVVFEDDSMTGWGQVVRLDAGTSVEASAQFGCSLATDGTSIIVGACLEDTVPGGSDRGAGYIYTKVGGTWTLQQRLAVASSADQDRFGRSVEIDGSTAFLGSRGAEAVVIHEFSSSTWTLVQPTLTSGNAVSDADFGIALASSSGRLLLGARADDTSQGSSAGAAYLFSPLIQRRSSMAPPNQRG